MWVKRMRECHANFDSWPNICALGSQTCTAVCRKVAELKITARPELCFLVDAPRDRIAALRACICMSGARVARAAAALESQCMHSADGSTLIWQKTHVSVVCEIEHRACRWRTFARIEFGMAVAASSWGRMVCPVRVPSKK